MHLSEEQLMGTLDESQQQHLTECQSCQQKHQLMSMLRSSAAEMPLLQPSAACWDEVRKRSVVERKKSKNWMAIAAAVMMMSLPTFYVSKNLLLEHQLNTVIEESQLLEKELRENKQYGSSSREIWQIQRVDWQINSAKSDNERLELWQNRKRLLEQLKAQLNQNPDNYI